ncbi:MAG: ribosome maturation factor RimP [Lachnospiraceae bacterium]|nr:ribosome maturation factor RimP [Lachnospiraceae bacterium]
MVKREEIEARTEELVLPLVAEKQFELVDVEYVKEGGSYYLRIYIDKEGGITVNDCEDISRPFSDILDQEDYIEGSYILEVSSPGLGRPLKKEKDFKRSLGEEVEIRLFRQVEHQKEWIGLLTAYDQQTVTIETEDGREMTFERSNLALIRLAFFF